MSALTARALIEGAFTPVIRAGGPVRLRRMTALTAGALIESTGIPVSRTGGPIGLRRMTALAARTLIEGAIIAIRCTGGPIRLRRILTLSANTQIICTITPVIAICIHRTGPASRDGCTGLALPVHTSLFPGTHIVVGTIHIRNAHKTLISLLIAGLSRRTGGPGWGTYSLPARLIAVTKCPVIGAIGPIRLGRMSALTAGALIEGAFTPVIRTGGPVRLRRMTALTAGALIESTEIPVSRTGGPVRFGWVSALAAHTLVEGA
jgi:hypothetical protein